MFDIEIVEKLSYDEEMALLRILFERQNKRVEAKAKAKAKVVADNEVVSSYLERPYEEETRELVAGEKPTSNDKYDDDELQWHRGDVACATMVMADVCSANETISLLQALIRLMTDKQFNGVNLKPDEYWSDFGKQILSC